MAWSSFGAAGRLNGKLGGRNKVAELLPDKYM
jgi:hypothetical protein